ncbi:murein transglycosylase A [Sphingomonas sp. MMS24-J13]|uniref:murein transglycosylase A n=1 Tax=Sphingomonas sp. MMS24-J13 TaxID=3238686 RepID=UPI00384F5412
MRGPFRAGLALALTLAVAACVGPPKRAPVSHRPPPHRASPAPRPQPKPQPPAPPPPKNAVDLGVSNGPPVSSLDLSTDTASAARSAFLSSCRVLTRRNDASKLTRPSDWLPACTAAAASDSDPVLFFQQQFETAIVGSGATYDTGYYEPEIQGSRTHDPGYDTPVYRRPPDLVEIDPGIAAGRTATGKKQRGRMQNGQLVPYYERAEIDNGALANQDLEIAWAQDPVELFFLEIQGSGRLRLSDGTIMRIGYDGQNGRDYVGIGKWMRDQGMIGGTTGYATSMQGIMQWLRDHPDQAAGVMQQNKSYVFFRELTGPGPIGALGVPVVGHVSIAADPNFTPLGAPVWISADRPEVTGLWVAQDSGGAIRGPNRFDTFWGAGVLARITAGGMSARGQALILVPRGTMARLAAPKAGLTATPASPPAPAIASSPANVSQPSHR